ncbi:(2Fe-2S)-binding protein [Halobacteriales archaeon QS_8_69_26]|nr:MAG: (2Fe-2S)-binding protein [Halobacteriales archaeon QS_8_69_26]
MSDPDTYTLEFVEEGRTIDCAADEYVLDAALEADVEIPYSCLMGICTICSARVEGDIDQSEGAALTEPEIQRGYALTCIGYPRSDLRILTSEGP